MTQTAKLLRLAAATAAALALTGCLGLGGGKPPPSLLSLTPTMVAPAGALASGTGATAIMVMEPETDKRLAVQRVPVQVSATSVAYLKDALWVERPARLFRGLLAETLRAYTQQAGAARLVLEDDQASPLVTTRLSGRLLDMGYDAQAMTAVVRFDAFRTGPKGEVTTRRFESVVPGVAAESGAVGVALNRAANDVAGQVAEWMVR
ncbi:ABC-type transport auxiliary lipoprotein family protein [Novosphingobium sp.]|uniref:ABC-type transport auxiliary lipoprotein family protein n=1 Tax=Novosphingobium sp. TaxID=1874826 RepID=UPI002733C734|nr:ABC-type transport auxiliary lipoprotein family protein [Novosphingobium sp.]MDP3905814.1 ABC-type transport auxiliary lipoprotein family protein [Novosphingobium sp.]